MKMKSIKEAKLRQILKKLDEPRKSVQVAQFEDIIDKSFKSKHAK